MPLAPVSAQPGAAPDPADALRRHQQTLDQQLRRIKPPAPAPTVPSAEAARGTPARLPDDEQPCARIQQIELTGPDAQHYAWLLDQLAGPAGDDGPLRRCLGSGGIALIQQRAQEALAQRGWITSRVLVQPQNLNRGTLSLSVIAGRIRAIRPDAASDWRILPAPAAPMMAGDIVQAADIEQMLDNLRRVPGVRAQARVEPADGADPALSDVVVDIGADSGMGRPARIHLSLDDAGSRGTGRLQGSVSLALYNPLALNDVLYVSTQSDVGGHIDARLPGPRGTRADTVHYSLAAGYWGLSFTHSAQHYHQRVAGAAQDYTYSGDSRSTEVQATRVLWRDGASRMSASLKAFARRSANAIDDLDIPGQRRATGGWEAGLQQRGAWGAALLDGGVRWQRGTGAFGALAAPEEGSGQGTSRFSLWTAHASVRAPLSIAGQTIGYHAQWHAQFNRGPVSPPQRMAIGGRHTVRGFDGEATLAAERGWTLRQELSWSPGSGAVELYAGVDHGQVGGPSASALVGRSLSGAVLGLRARWAQAARSPDGAGPSMVVPVDAQLELFIASPLARPAAFGSGSAVTGFQLVLGF